MASRPPSAHRPGESQATRKQQMQELRDVVDSESCKLVSRNAEASARRAFAEYGPTDSDPPSAKSDGTSTPTHSDGQSNADSQPAVSTALSSTTFSGKHSTSSSSMQDGDSNDGSSEHEQQAGDASSAPSDERDASDSPSDDAHDGGQKRRQTGDQVAAFHAPVIVLAQDELFTTPRPLPPYRPPTTYVRIFFSQWRLAANPFFVILGACVVTDDLFTSCLQMCAEPDEMSNGGLGGGLIGTSVPAPATSPALKPGDTKRSNHDDSFAPQRRCESCGTTETPKWRSGTTLCNACGLREAKKVSVLARHPCLPLLLCVPPPARGARVYRCILLSADALLRINDSACLWSGASWRRILLPRDDAPCNVRCHE